MQRKILGILSLVLLVGGGALMLLAPESEYTQNLLAPCFRMGVVLGALWLALPDLQFARNRLWLLAIGGTLLVIVRWPKLIPLALGALGLFAILRPRLPRMPPSKPRAPRAASQDHAR